MFINISVTKNTYHREQIRLCLVLLSFFIILLSPQVGWSRSSISELETRLEELENKLDSNLNLELSNKVEFLQKEIQELRGTIEEQQHLIATLKKDTNQKESDQIPIDPNKTEIKKKELDKSSSTEQNQIQNNNPKPVKLESEQVAYNSAYKLIENKNFAQAIIAFKDFLWQYNNSKYAANATYWLGELYLTDHHFDLAADYFLQVVNKYKEHAKAPDALLKLGMLEIERENWQGAKDYFMQIKKDYANSSRVLMAEAKLQSLQRDGH